MVADDVLSAAVEKVFALRPTAIIERLQLRRPIYRANCNYGHFGKENMPWEQTDFIDALKAAVNK